MNEPSDRAVAERVVDVFNNVTLEGQSIHSSFRLPLLAGAVAVVLGISVPAAYMLIASMS